MTNATPTEVEYFQEHLAYEIKMLNATLHLSDRRLAKDASDEEKVILNACIESFCVHARALIEFFEMRSKPTSEKHLKNTVYLARRFTNDAYQLNRPKRVDTIGRLLNQQIAHLKDEGRKKDNAEKVDDKLRHEIASILFAEIQRFKKHLKPPYSAADVPRLLPDRRTEIKVGGITTTNQFQVWSGPVAVLTDRGKGEGDRKIDS